MNLSTCVNSGLFVSEKIGIAKLPVQSHHSSGSAKIEKDAF
jgi:hypothetical protein